MVFRTSLNSKVIPLFIKQNILYFSNGTPRYLTKKLSNNKIKKYANFVTYNINKIIVNYKTISVPILLVWGNRDTIITPIKFAMEIHKEVKKSKLVIVNGGHSVLYWKPEEVIDKIIKNLSKI